VDFLAFHGWFASMAAHYFIFSLPLFKGELIQGAALGSNQKKLLLSFDNLNYVAAIVPSTSVYLILFVECDLPVMLCVSRLYREFPFSSLAPG
jgi:hypothetical protein